VGAAGNASHRPPSSPLSGTHRPLRVDGASANGSIQVVRSARDRLRPQPPLPVGGWWEPPADGQRFYCRRGERRLRPRAAGHGVRVVRDLPLGSPAGQHEGVSRVASSVAESPRMAWRCRWLIVRLVCAGAADPATFRRLPHLPIQRARRAGGHVSTAARGSPLFYATPNRPSRRQWLGTCSAPPDQSGAHHPMRSRDTPRRSRDGWRRPQPRVAMVPSLTAARTGDAW